MLIVQNCKNFLRKTHVWKIKIKITCKKSLFLLIKYKNLKKLLEKLK